jgi:hypothetical protein
MKMIRRRRQFGLLALLGVLPAWGCVSTTETELRMQVKTLQEQTAEKDNRLAAQQATIEKLHQQLQTVRGWTDDDLKLLFTPVKIEIASLSGGEDYDGKPGDDGVTVYIRPVDRDGDTLKVAGDLRVELYDLAAPSGENLIGQYAVPVARAAELWYGKFMTYHYTMRCPWLNGPPKHEEITIRATFVDFLTQRVMTTQTTCKVKLPEQPAPPPG